MEMTSRLEHQQTSTASRRMPWNFLKLVWDFHNYSLGRLLLFLSLQEYLKVLSTATDLIKRSLKEIATTIILVQGLIITQIVALYQVEETRVIPSLFLSLLLIRLHSRAPLKTQIQLLEDVEECRLTLFSTHMALSRTEVVFKEIFMLDILAKMI